jgi:hypothetical protein
VVEVAEGLEGMVLLGWQGYIGIITAFEATPYMITSTHDLSIA